MADTGRAELEGQFRDQHHPCGWQIPDGYPALPGRTGLHPPGPSDQAGWAAALVARPDLAPALGFDDCLACTNQPGFCGVKNSQSRRPSAVSTRQ